MTPTSVFYPRVVCASLSRACRERMQSCSPVIVRAAALPRASTSRFCALSLAWSGFPGSTALISLRLSLSPSRSFPADAFRGEPVALAVAVARPGRVRESLDADVVLFETRRDHHPWNASELEAIATGASRKGARALLVTGKDAAKLEEGEAATLPIYRIDIESEILDAAALGALLDAVPSLTILG